MVKSCMAPIWVQQHPASSACSWCLSELGSWAANPRGRFFLTPLLLGRSVCRPWSSPAWLPSGSSSTGLQYLLLMSQWTQVLSSKSQGPVKLLCGPLLPPWGRGFKTHSSAVVLPMIPSNEGRWRAITESMISCECLAGLPWLLFKPRKKLELQCFLIRSWRGRRLAALGHQLVD